MFSVGWQIRDEPRAEAKRPRRAKSANALAAKSHSKFVKWRARELVCAGRAPGATPRKILNDVRAYVCALTRLRGSVTRKSAREQKKPTPPINKTHRRRKKKALKLQNRGFILAS